MKVGKKLGKSEEELRRRNECKQLPKPTKYLVFFGLII